MGWSLHNYNLFRKSDSFLNSWYDDSLYISLHVIFWENTSFSNLSKFHMPCILLLSLEILSLKTFHLLYIDDLPSTMSALASSPITHRCPMTMRNLIAPMFHLTLYSDKSISLLSQKQSLLLCPCYTSWTSLLSWGFFQVPTVYANCYGKRI